MITIVATAEILGLLVGQPQRYSSNVEPFNGLQQTCQFWSRFVLPLIITTSGQILNTGRQDNGICREMKCNSLESLMNLNNCVVVLGDLKILIENSTATSFKDLQFPELREVTGFMVVYRVTGLKSLGKLFPNLARIRGTHLMDNFALIVHDMPNLQEVGLYSLLKVDRGGVAISGGAHTCFINTVDWNAIAPNSKHVLATEDGHCKTTCICGKEGTVITDKCWNTRNCQRFLDGPEAEVGCHPQCLGCSGKSDHCAVCRHYTYRRKCVHECPKDTLILNDNQYCVTKEECSDLEGMIFNGMCLLQCPVDYTRNFDPSSRVDTCIPCTNCQKTCSKQILQSLSAVQRAEGCVYINGSLTIHIRSVPDAMEELTKYLSRIQEVADYIIIYGSMTITSLDFLPSLKLIKGKKLWKKAYSLVIHDMENLESLFLTNVTRNLKIARGKLRVLRNPMLCKREIDKILPLFPEVSNETDFPFEMNGYGRNCDGTSFNLEVQVLEETSVVLTFSPLKNPKVQYTILYVKLPSGYKKTSLPDPCSKPEWHTVSASSHGIVKLKNLHPASTYAVFLETYIYSNKSEERKLSRSKIVNFTTPIGKPASPFITEIYATSSSDVVLRWFNHKDYREHITHYELDVSLIEIHPKDLIAKDHCKHIEVAVEESHYSRHVVALKPPKDYVRSCESMCEHIISATAAVVPDDYFEVCDSADLDDDIYETPVTKNTSFLGYIKTATIRINTHNENYQVGGLAPFRDYKFRLRACVESVCSISNRAAVRTLRSPQADVPSDVYSNAIHFTSIYVEWNSPNETNGPIFAYIVNVLPVAGETNTTLPKTFCVSPNQHHLILDAKTSKIYKVRVCTSTLGSISACSDWTVVTLPESSDLFLWSGLSFGFILAVISLLIGFRWGLTPDRSDLIPLVEYMSDDRIESEPPRFLMCTDFGTLYTVPLRDTLL